MPDKEWLYPNLHENGYTYSALENLHYIPHVHGGLECVYVLDGELCATIDEKNYTLKKGDICLIFPQVRHSYRTPNHSNIFCFALLHDTIICQHQDSIRITNTGKSVGYGQGRASLRQLS